MLPPGDDLRIGPLLRGDKGGGRDAPTKNAGQKGFRRNFVRLFQVVEGCQISKRQMDRMWAESGAGQVQNVVVIGPGEIHKERRADRIKTVIEGASHRLHMQHQTAGSGQFMHGAINLGNVEHMLGGADIGDHIERPR